MVGWCTKPHTNFLINGHQTTIPGRWYNRFSISSNCINEILSLELNWLGMMDGMPPHGACDSAFSNYKIVAKVMSRNGPMVSSGHVESGHAWGQFLLANSS